MPAAKFKLIIEKGATLNPTWTWQLESADGVKTPVDLTGYTARAHVRSEIESDPPVLDMTTANGQIVLGTTDGKITLNVPADVTADLEIETGVWDLELSDDNETPPVVTRLLEGAVVVKPEVTR